MKQHDNEKRHTQENKTRLIPVPRWNDHHPWPPQGGLRHLIFHKESNGFGACVRRVGRRLLIDEAAFFEWVEQQNEKPETGHGGR